MKKVLPALILFFSVTTIYSQSHSFTGVELKSIAQTEFSEIFNDYKLFELNSKGLDTYVKSSNYQSKLHLRLGSEYDWEMDLFENDMRSSNYRLRVATENGVVASTVSENITYEGFLRKYPDSQIRLTIKGDFIYGYIRQNDKDIFIEPANRFSKSAASNHYVIYKASDVRENSDVKCGVTDFKQATKSYFPKSEKEDSKLLACKRLELAIASDYSYMIARGGDVGDASAAALAVMNNVEGDYTGSFNDNIEFEIVEQYISACSTCDPWTSSTNAGTLLSDFRSWGNDGGFTVGTGFDLGQIWTARNICSSGCGTVGLAYIGVVCGSSRYHLLEDYNTNANNLRVLTSHEIGHNFDLVHDAQGSGFIMAPSVNNTSTWSAASISTFNSYITTISCLDGCSTPTCNPVTDFVIQELTNGSPQLQLSWTPSGATDYRISVRDQGSSTNIFSMITSSTSLSIDPEMEMCKMYEVIVESFCGGSNYSTPIVGLIENQTVAEPNDAIITDCSSSTTVPLNSTLTDLGQYEVIGWWITEDQPISNTINNGNKNTLLSNATLESPLSNPVDHIYEASNPPSQPYSLTFDCSALNTSKNYYATPFVSNKKPFIADVSCNVNASYFSGTFNDRPARLGRIYENDICRPASPPNMPTYNYTLTVSGFSGNAANHFACIFSGSGDDCFIQLSGNGNYTIPSSASIPDPGIDGLDFWVWEEGGDGMSGASISVTLNITYPGCTQIDFPDISNIDICTIGDPIQINCSCPPPCSITNPSASSVSCDGQNATFSMSFTVVDGSGSYEVVDASNNVVGSGSSSPIPVSVPGPTTASNQDFRVRDANNISCISSDVSVSIPTCILPCNAASPATVSGTISSDTLRTKTYLTSTADVTSGNVKFQARDSVILSNNFEVNTNGVFEVQIGDCDDNP